MNIDSAVLNVLGNASTDGATLKLTGQLDRPLYVAVNKVLEAAGGKWNRKAQAHIFEDDAAEIMDAIILSGKVVHRKQELGQFFTPKELAVKVCDAAEIEQGMLVLEPSAGQGSLAVEAAKRGAIVHCFEIDPKNCERLVSAMFATAPEYCVNPNTDFLTIVPEKAYYGNLFERIVMNPPFAKQADIKHVLHAIPFLAPGGRLVSIMSAGVTFRTNSLTLAFNKAFAAHTGTIEMLPGDSFSESGTNVNTVMVTLDN